MGEFRGSGCDMGDGRVRAIEYHPASVRAKKSRLAAASDRLTVGQGFT
jgi:hypothetical protein